MIRLTHTTTFLIKKLTKRRYVRRTRTLEDKMNPSTWLSATEQPSGIEMQALCIDAMRLLTENMSIDELGAEIRRLTPLIRGLVVHEETDETVRLKVAAEWNELSEAAVSDDTSRKVSRFVRDLYTHETWPSPLPRLMALELGLTTDKRIKHVKAIRLLAHHLGYTPFDFISKERREMAESLFPVSQNYYWGSRDKMYGVRRILYR